MWWSGSSGLGGKLKIYFKRVFVNLRVILFTITILIIITLLHLISEIGGECSKYIREPFRMHGDHNVDPWIMWSSMDTPVNHATYVCT